MQSAHSRGKSWQFFSGAAVLLFALVTSTLAQESAPPPTAPASAEPVDAAEPVATPPAETPELPASTAQPAATPALASGARPGDPPPATTAPEMLQAMGVEPSYFELVADGSPVDDAETEAVIKMLYAVRRFDPLKTYRWRQSPKRLPTILETPDEHRGLIIPLSGRVLSVTPIQPIPEVRTRFELPVYYQVELEPRPGSPFQRATIYCLQVPKVWLETSPPPGEWRASCLGFFFKVAEPGTAVFIANRMAWHPPGILGDAGMDFGLFDAVKDGNRQLPRDAFYELLAAAGRANNNHMIRQTRLEENGPRFGPNHVHDWFVLPWKLRLGSLSNVPSPARQVWLGLSESTQLQLLNELPDRMPSPELQQTLLGELNRALTRTDLYDPVAWDELYLDLQVQALIEEGVQLLGRESFERFRKLAQAEQKPLRDQGRPWRGNFKSPELQDLAKRGVAQLPLARLQVLNRYLLEIAFPQEIAPTRPASVVPLFLTPNTQRGRLIKIEGTCRRAVKIAVTDPEIVARLGIKQYYEMWVYTQDSQNLPLVVCVREMPKHMPLGDDIYEAVVVPAFFFKHWAYESADFVRKHGLWERDVRLARAQKEEDKLTELLKKEPRMPLAPMLIGQLPQWIKDAGKPVNDPFYGYMAAVLLMLCAGGVCVWAWRYDLDDQRFQKQVIARHYVPVGGSLNDLNFDVAPEVTYHDHGKDDLAMPAEHVAPVENTTPPAVDSTREPTGETSSVGSDTSARSEP